jgi:glycosyltransferase involved in cell wall biosynthesis
MTEITTIPEPTASQMADRLKDGPASAAPDAFSQLCEQFDATQVSAACAGRFWDEPARFWRLVGESPLLSVKPRQVKTIGLCYFRLGIGGAERVVAFLANLWTEMGYRVVLFCDEDPTDEDYEVPATVERVKLPLFLDANAENYGARAELLAVAIRSFDLDLMVYHQWLSHALPWDMLTCKLLGVPLLLFTHGVYGCMYRWSNRWEMQLPVVAGYSDGVIALDAADVRFWSEHCPRVWQTANPVTLLPDESKVSPLEGETIVWVGRLDPTQKQPAEALEVMRLVLQEVPTVKLLMVGPAPDQRVMDDLLSTADRLGISDSVTFTGPKKDVSPYLESASVYLSTSCLEGWYLSLAEGMARGLPAVAYELPYLTLLQGDCGCVQVPQGDRAGAAAALVGLLRSKEDRKRLGAAAFATISEVAVFDYEGFWRGVFGEVEAGGMPPRDAVADTMWDIMLQANLHASDARDNEVRAAYETRDGSARGERLAQQRIAELEGSTTFRVGRAITAIPCKVKDIFRSRRG